MEKSKAMTALCIGNTYLDEIVALPEFPTPDSKIAATSVESSLGGSATNACCAFRAYGVNCHLHSLLGDGEKDEGDDVARKVKQLLQKQRVPMEHCIEVPHAKGGRTIVLVTPDGISTKLGYSTLGNTELLKHLKDQDVLQSFDHIHLASVSTDVASAVLSRLEAPADKKLPTVSLDIGAAMLATKDANQERSLFARLDYVFLNRTALQVFYDIDIDKAGKDWPETLRSKYFEQHSDAKKDATLVITLGSHGAYAVSNRGIFFQRAAPTQLADTTGAGDAFNTAYITLQLQYKIMDDDEALAKAHIAAAIKIQHKGGTHGHPSIEHVSSVYTDTHH